MPTPAVDYTNTAEAGADGGENELIQGKPSFLLVETMKIQPSLNGKTPRAKVVEIKAPMRMNRTFDVLGGVFNFDVAVLQEFFEHTQSMCFIVLRLDLSRRTMVKRDGAPAQSLDALHRMTKQILIRHSLRKLSLIHI